MIPAVFDYVYHLWEGDDCRWHANYAGGVPTRIPLEKSITVYYKSDEIIGTSTYIEYLKQCFKAGGISALPEQTRGVSHQVLKEL
jgi:hypothetical protein